MPLASDFEGHERLVRCLAYGKEKSKKTWWACRAAEAGYNVLLIDGDDGAHIVRQLPPEARKRILVVNTVNLQDRAVFALFMAQFCRPNNSFVWDEQEKRSILGKRNIGHSHIEFCPSKLTANDVVIIDSWTALAASTLLQFAIEQHLDLSDAKKTEWDGYGFQGRFLDYVLNSIHALPCHVIVIGHSYTYEKFKGQGKERTLVSATTQPISATGPHGQKLGKHFSDVLYFNQLSSVVYTISTTGDSDRVGGSRLFAPKDYKWDEFLPEKLFEAVGAKPTNSPMLGAVFLPAGTPQEIPSSAVKPLTVASTSESKPIVPQAQEVVQSGGSLLQRLRLPKSA